MSSPASLSHGMSEHDIVPWLLPQHHYLFTNWHGQTTVIFLKHVYYFNVCVCVCACMYMYMCVQMLNRPEELL